MGKGFQGVTILFNIFPTLSAFDVSKKAGAPILKIMVRSLFSGFVFFLSKNSPTTMQRLLLTKQVVLKIFVSMDLRLR